MTVEMTPGAQHFLVQQGGLFSKKPTSWIEVDQSAQLVRRVVGKQLLWTVPTTKLQRLFVLEINWFKADNFGILHDGYTVFELHAECTFDAYKLETDLMGFFDPHRAMHRGAFGIGSLKIGATGREIAAACGAIFDETIRTLPPVMPVPQAPTEQEKRLVWTLTHFSTDKSAKAAAARELGRLASPCAGTHLERAAKHKDQGIRDAAQWGMHRLSTRMQAPPQA